MMDIHIHNNVLFFFFCRPKLHCVVDFPEEGLMTVPRNWVLWDAPQQVWYCLYPRHFTPREVTAAIQACDKPDPKTWVRLGVSMEYRKGM